MWVLLWEVIDSQVHLEFQFEPGGGCAQFLLLLCDFCFRYIQLCMASKPSNLYGIVALKCTCH